MPTPKRPHPGLLHLTVSEAWILRDPIMVNWYCHVLDWVGFDRFAAGVGYGANEIRVLMGPDPDQIKATEFCVALEFHMNGMCRRWWQFYGECGDYWVHLNLN